MSGLSTSIAALLALLLALAGPKALDEGQAPAAPSGERGPLVLVGGGQIPAAVVQRCLELAGGAEAKIAILPQASSRSDRGKGSSELFLEAGARHVEVVETEDAQRARQKIAEADLIWMSGGSQSRLVEALREAGLVEAVRAAHARGAVIGGTSAGAASVSKVMITGQDYDLKSLSAQRTHVSEGLGLWPQCIVDQHLLRRNRTPRLITAVLDRPELVGVGIDESTAVVVKQRSIEVIGESNVVIVDARSARVHAADRGAPAAAQQVTLHVLRPGMTFELP